MKTLKKLFLLFILSWFITPFLASAGAAPDEGDIPIVLIEVSKTNGGILSIINLYKDVQFTLIGQSFDMITAKLHCSGAGFTPCRVPVGVVSSPGRGNMTTLEELSENNLFNQTVNYLLEYSENSCTNGKLEGSVTKKISVVKNGTSQLYVFSGTWKYDRFGNGNMQIKIYKNPSIMTQRG